MFIFEITSLIYKICLHTVKNIPLQRAISVVLQDKVNNPVDVYYFVHVKLFSTLFLCSVTTT